MSSHGQMFNLEKLTVREIFATWKFAAKPYLEHEDLWKYVQPGPGRSINSTKDVKAKAKLILLLDPQIYVHVQNCETAKQVWDNSLKAFDDRGLSRKVGLLKDFRNTGFEVNDEWFGTLMLAGLQDVYAPMTMAGAGEFGYRNKC